jgi:hypothetical protein
VAPKILIIGINNRVQLEISEKIIDNYSEQYRTALRHDSIVIPPHFNISPQEIRFPLSKGDM